MFSSLSTFHPNPMEDLWKDITLSSLHNPPASPQLRQTPTRRHHFQPGLPATNFQDFLARPSSSLHDHINNIAVASASSNNSPPHTILSLNADRPTTDFHLHDISSGHSPPTYHPLDNPSMSGNLFGERPMLETHELNLSNGQCPSDRRHKRMIKNRESAARSRARKQAYTTELELEVTQLTQENAKLRKEQEKWNQAALNQLPKIHKLHRTSTAPF